MRRCLDVVGVFLVHAPAGLARLTIRAPRRRIDLAVPHQVPLAELLPEVVARAAEAMDAYGAPVGGWVLRRVDGAVLSADQPLAAQGVRDGDVLYLVPSQLNWPEPRYDDVVEEIALDARGHGRAWDITVTRTGALVAVAVVVSAAAAGLVLLAGVVAGMAAAVVAMALLGAATVIGRGLGDGPAGAVAAAGAVGHAATAAGLLAAVGGGGVPARILVVGGTVLVMSLVGAAAAGYGTAFFTAGAVIGVAGLLGGVIAPAAGVPGAAAVVVALSAIAVGWMPAVAVRLGRLPVPVVSADPAEIVAERRLAPDELRSAVARADDILNGCLGGIAVATLVGVGVLAPAPGAAAGLLAVLASAALLLRARIFPTVGARSPLLIAGACGLAVTAWARLPGAGSTTGLAAVGIALGVVVVLLGIATAAGRRRGPASPYLARLAELTDIAATVLLAPVACAVLGLYGVVRGLLS
jgi:ESX secretion system protein EccD